MKQQQQQMIDDEDDESSTTVRLIGWIPVPYTGNDGDDGVVGSYSYDPYLSTIKKEHIRIYEATLNDTSTSKTLTARVRIDIARYPSIPPNWQIAPKDGSMKGQQQQPLYNEEIAKLEKHINYDIDQFVSPDDQTTYDWILAQQLYELIHTWDGETN
jgi:hypothetical protein